VAFGAQQQDLRTARNAKFGLIRAQVLLENLDVFGQYNQGLRFGTSHGMSPLQFPHAEESAGNARKMRTFCCMINSTGP
jgi:hypothetical protein